MCSFSDSWRHLGARVAVIALLTLSLFAGTSCVGGEKRELESSLTTEERAFYRERSSFSEIFDVQTEIQLGLAEGFELSIRPLIRAVTEEGDVVILDKLNVRTIAVFDSAGKAKGRIGQYGRGEGMYIYPHDLSLDKASGMYYVYDGDLLEILRYGRGLEFVDRHTVLVFADDLIPVPGGRLFAYVSSEIQDEKVRNVIYEIGPDGEILARFMSHPETYTRWASSEGGGVVAVGDLLYAITPYQYAISVYTLDGGHVTTKSQASSHYTAPDGTFKLDEGDPDAFGKLNAFHSSWSHIFQILNFGDRILGIVFAEPGEDRVFLDLFDTDLTVVAEDVELPPYVGELFADGNRLYMMLPEREDLGEGRLANPTLRVYRFTGPWPEDE